MTLSLEGDAPPCLLAIKRKADPAMERPFEFIPYRKNRKAFAPRFPSLLDEDEFNTVFRLVVPEPHRVYSNSNGSLLGTRYLRFAEEMPDGHQARHTYGRYIEAIFAVASELNGGLKAPAKGHIVAAIDHNTRNMLPSNRDVREAKLTWSRNGPDAVWSARIRLKGIMRGIHPDVAMEEARQDYRERHGRSSVEALA